MKIPHKVLRILLVDDDDCDRKELMRYVKSCLPDALLAQADCVASAKQLFDPRDTDFVIVDYQLPDGTGLEVMEHILTLSQFVPVVLLTGSGNEELAVRALHLGACDYLNKDSLNRDRVKQAIDNSIERRSIEQKVYHLAHYDQLTHLYNRTHFDSRLNHALKRSKRNQEKIAVMFMDLDGFKAINDRHGHAVGDKVLIETAKRLQCCVRDVDMVARFGGDEFAVILEELGDDERGCSAMIARRVFETISQPFIIDNLCLSIGISIGISYNYDLSISPEELTKEADKMMYQAKNSLLPNPLALSEKQEGGR